MKLIVYIVGIILLSCSMSDEEGGELYINYSYELKETYSKLETETLNSVNIYRYSIDKSTLQLLDNISSVAMSHTLYMIKTGEVNHLKFNERNDYLKYSEDAKKVGEVVAYGYGTSRGVLLGWLNSEKHKKIIDGSGYTHFGISIESDKSHRNYFTLILIKK